jgi:hypothetical protein
MGLDATGSSSCVTEGFGVNGVQHRVSATT